MKSEPWGIIAGALLAGLALTQCAEHRGSEKAKADVWNAYVYPQGTMGGNHIILRGFVSLEACRAAAMQVLGQISHEGYGEHECGRNCRPYANAPSIDICDETLD